MYDTEELGCDLYINSNQNQDELALSIAKIIGGIVHIGHARNEYIDMNVERNDHRDPKRIGEHAGFLYYPHYVEVEPYAEINSGSISSDNLTDDYRENYLDTLLQVIYILRESGAKVVASCTYEDLIAERTGWNWSETTPHHPPVGNGHSKTQE